MTSGGVAVARNKAGRCLTVKAGKVPVLVIEDDPFYVRKVRIGLGARYQCIDGLKLWNGSKFGRGKSLVAAAIVDLGLPDEFDVVSLLGRLALQYPGLPVIIMSGKDDKTLDVISRLAKAHKLRVAGVLKKPFRMQELLSMLEEVRNDSVRTEPEVVPESTVACFEPAAIYAGMQMDQFVLHYQPQVCMAKGEVVGVEALCRWNKPEQGIIGPNAFIAAVEHDSNLAVDFTLYIAAKAFDDFAYLTEKTKFDGNLSINVPLLAFNAGGFAERLYRVIESAGVVPERVTIELTEHGFGSNQHEIISNLARMRIRNFRLAIDDFGTGNSSFCKLKELGFDELKIDKGFIRDVHWNAKSQTIVRYLVNLAREMNLTVVAEGVEELESLRYLMKFCAPIVQGYYFSRPLALPDVLAFIDRSSFLTRV